MFVQFYLDNYVDNNMKFKKQSVKLPVINLDRLVGENITKRLKRHGSLLPDSIRGLFCGPSGCGKTNALISLITHANGLKFENIYVYSKSLNQPKYVFLEELLKPIKGIEYFKFHDREQVISPEHANPNSIMIFDDIACEKQDSLKAYFCMGRHKSVDSFYLCQSYAQVPKHLVRDNVNLIVLFKMDEMNLKHIYDDHVNTDMSYDKFKTFCLRCWNSNTDDDDDDEEKTHGFVVIDKSSRLQNGRYRNRFDQFLINDEI